MTVDNAVLQKIKKCLALGQSSNANEAATALRHAQALMRQHNLSEADVAGITIETDTVKTTEGFGRCTFLNQLGGLLRDAFGVVAIMERNPGSANRANIKYIGPEGRAALAAYAHQVIVRAVNHEWDSFLEKYPHFKGKSGKRTAFRLGWLVSVREQVTAIGFTDMEKQAIATWKEKTYGGALTVSSPQKIKLDRSQMSIAQHGVAAGASFRLHRPMHSDGTPAEEQAPLAAIGHEG